MSPNKPLKNKMLLNINQAFNPKHKSKTWYLTYSRKIKLLFKNGLQFEISILKKGAKKVIKIKMSGAAL